MNFKEFLWLTIPGERLNPSFLIAIGADYLTTTIENFWDFCFPALLTMTFSSGSVFV